MPPPTLTEIKSYNRNNNNNYFRFIINTLIKNVLLYEIIMLIINKMLINTLIKNVLLMYYFRL